MTRWLSRSRTLLDLLAHFARRQKLLLIPLLLVLLLAGALLAVTGSLGVVAPFVYTLF